ncbi:MAG: T9SS type A sorting domain-containing protein [Chitinophagaceae bacterium]|nr:T9SS type A sorting domain-containing protein [Chitinophagaceae bacterium]
MKQKYQLLLLGLLGWMNASAQMLTPKTMNSGGNSSVVNNIYLEASLGELFTTTLHPTAAGNMITQGFIQPAAENAVPPPPPPPATLQMGTSGIDNGGTTLQAGNFILEFTLGEFMTAPRTGNNRMLTQGILQPYSPNETALPVTGLSFIATRKNQQLVELKWETKQEMNNKGFTIERKFQHQSKFDSLAFVKSASPDGNSNFSLKYNYNDNNTSNEITYYRLKQVDIDGKFSYSETRLVKGISASEQLIKIWPIPNNGNFQVLVTGNEGKTNLTLFAADGKLIRQIQVNNNQPHQISGIKPGIYFLKADNMPSQRIIIN